jgi:acylglycerol lipase
MVHFDFTLTSHGLQLFGQGWSTDTHPHAVVCLVHGLGEHSSRYAHMAKAFTNAGIAVLAMDLCGHGKSTGKRGFIGKYDFFLDDIDLLLIEARLRFPGVPLFLYGHSLGGNLVLYYAMRKRPQINGVIDSAGVLRLGFKPPASKIALAKIMKMVFPGFAMANELDRIALSHDKNVITAYNRDPLVHDRLSSALGLGFLESGEWLLAHAAEFPPIPLLVMHGSKDRITSPEASQQFASTAHGDVTYKSWEDLFHEIHNEPQKKEVFDFTINWINDHLNTVK